MVEIDKIAEQVERSRDNLMFKTGLEPNAILVSYPVMVEIRAAVVTLSKDAGFNGYENILFHGIPLVLVASREWYIKAAILESDDLA